MTEHPLDRRPIGMRACAALIMAAGLQGCVAAVVPIVAGTALAQETVLSQNGSDDTVNALEDEPLTEDLVVQEEAGTRSLAEQAMDEIAEQVAERKPTESSDEEPVEAVSPPAPLEPAVFAEMTAYVLEALSKKTKPSESQSALLADPSSLEPQRTNCGTARSSTIKSRPPAVLIDLDDKNGVFDPTVIAPTYDGDAYGHLSRLREAGVTIGWMSALTAADAGGIRKALQASGLDVAGEDALVLFRYPDDRKQTRRSEFGAEHCLIAIAGDDRADFDELYQYLLRPDSAVRLEPLIGNGWFLLPTGLSMRTAPEEPEAEADEAKAESEEPISDSSSETEANADPEAELPPIDESG